MTPDMCGSRRFDEPQGFHYFHQVDIRAERDGGEPRPRYARDRICLRLLQYATPSAGSGPAIAAKPGPAHLRTQADAERVAQSPPHAGALGERLDYRLAVCNRRDPVASASRVIDPWPEHCPKPHSNAVADRYANTDTNANADPDADSDPGTDAQPDTDAESDGIGR